MKKNLARTCIALCFIFSVSSCTDYGDKSSKGHIDVYYKDGISQETAQKTADFLFEIDSLSNNTTTQKSFQLAKKQDTICFRMVTDPKKLGTVTDDNFYTMANLLSDSVFNNAPVNIELTDNHFKTIRNLTFVKMDLNNIK
ncbi:MAG: hypothetical protein ACHQF0_01070 [Chitinophagales bacterium]